MFIIIKLYSGTPGSGKSYHAAMEIYNRLYKLKKDVICNFSVNTTIKKNKGNFIFKPNNELSPEFLIDYANKNHKKNKESQTLIVVDECQILFNPRTWSDKSRLKWVEFFTVHRHLGYDILLISQNERFIDRQIRCLIETEFKHRKLNNFKFADFMPCTVFVCIEFWVGAKQKVSSKIFRYKKKYAKIYDTFDTFI